MHGLSLVSLFFFWGFFGATESKKRKRRIFGANGKHTCPSYCESHKGGKEPSRSSSMAAPPPSEGNPLGAVLPLLHLDNTKAGMALVDKSKVEAIINEASRGSAFYVNEQRKALLRQKKCEGMKQKSEAYDKLPVRDRRKIAQDVDALVLQFESRRHFGVYVYLDMDMFYAAVEEKRNPSLRTVPFGVGGMGMLSTTNYLARAFGVRAGMPGFVGKKLCPELVFAFSGHSVYRAESEAVKEIAKEFDPEFASIGLDELTLDVASYVVSHPFDGDSPLAKAAALATTLRQKIVEATQLTGSCGIACTPCLAKIVSNYNKPNGQFLLPANDRDSVLAFMKELPVRSVPGIGKVMEEILNTAFGITTCGQLLEHRERLSFCFPSKSFCFLLEVALGVMRSFSEHDPHEGCDDGNTDESQGRKSVGHERTLRPPMSPQDLIDIAEKNLMRSHQQLVEENLFAGQVNLKLKYTSFEVRNVSIALAEQSQCLDAMLLAVHQLLQPFLADYNKFRLLGVRLSELTDSKQVLVEPSPSKSCGKGSRHQQQHLDKWLTRGHTPQQQGAPQVVDLMTSDDDEAEVVVVDELPSERSRNVHSLYRKTSTAKKRERSRSDAEQFVLSSSGEDSDVVIIDPTGKNTLLR